MESHANHCMSVNTIYQCTKKVNTPYRIIMRIVIVVIESTAASKTSDASLSPGGPNESLRPSDASAC